MSAHVLLNLLNELGKRDKMRGLPSILSLFRNEFNKFNNKRARMFNSIYHMINTLKFDFWPKNVIILSLYVCNVVMDFITFPVNLYRFYCMALFHSQTQRHMINSIISCPCLNNIMKFNHYQRFMIRLWMFVNRL